MYVLVHHTVHDPDRFWATAEATLPKLPAALRLHQTLSARDGTRATCLWEAASVEAVQDFLEPRLGAVSTNAYAEAENREGIALPTMLHVAAAPQPQGAVGNPTPPVV
jgi:hypothetical protein